jgi:GT2 family glycosyltransferase
LKLSVVILNWNALEDSIRCLERLRMWKTIQTRTFLIDNASASGEADSIASNFPKIEVIRSEENLGFSGGTNLGIVRALDASDAPILLLNNDVLIEEDDVSHLLGSLQSATSTGLIAPVLHHAVKTEEILSAGSRNPVLRRFHTIHTPPNPDGISGVPSVSGAAVVIRPEVFDAIGLLDESYFFATELADLCRRASRAGFGTSIDPGARAFHNIDRSSRFRETLYVYYVIRNRFLYIRKFHRLSGPVLAASWALHGYQQAFRLKRAGRQATAMAISMGVTDGLRGRFGGQNDRILNACRDLPNATADRP